MQSTSRVWSVRCHRPARIIMRAYLHSWRFIITCAVTFRYCVWLRIRVSATGRISCYKMQWLVVRLFACLLIYKNLYKNTFTQTDASSANHREARPQTVCCPVPACCSSPSAEVCSETRREVAADNAVVWSTDAAFPGLSTSPAILGTNDICAARNKLQHSTCSLVNASSSGVHPVLFVMSVTFIW